ncbi:Phage related hypothetical protein [Onishia taeanensis]|uniref:Uncharacterized protein n=1 Tax=Onishia taeanensis TaxID=284577 RepID=A0A1G7NFW2_9GAMM|nr:DUF1799 domain-containing protein [Halomonas taeanensis]SDF72842.1 Phage related hypothetical protein [Halomonas taeanensis]
MQSLGRGAAGRVGACRKKLNDLGRAWARGRGGAKNELKSDLEAWGVEAPQRLQQPSHNIIWPENAQAFEVFRDCASQWRYITPVGAAPVPTGIERTALASSMQMLGIDDTRDTLKRVQHIEAGALAVMRE